MGPRVLNAAGTASHHAGNGVRTMMLTGNPGQGVLQQAPVPSILPHSLGHPVGPRLWSGVSPPHAAGASIPAGRASTACLQGKVSRRDQVL